MDAAKDGDTIIVYSGTYTENIDVNKELIIISKSENPEDTIVKAAVSDDYVFNVIGKNVTISGFNVTGATGYRNAGIYLNGVEGSIITNNIVSDNSCGIYLNSSSDNTLTSNNVLDNYHGIFLLDSSDNTLTDNTASGNKYGIYLCDSSNNTQTKFLLDSSDNTLTDNTASDNYYGIYLCNSSNNTLTNNKASDNDYYGIHLESSSGNTLTDNTASGNKYGIHLWDSSDNNILTSNTASGNEYGILLRDSRDNTLIDNTMIDNTYNFGGGGINDIDTSNTVDGKPIYYLVNLSDIILDSTSNAGIVYCINCQNISIKNLNLENNECGICLYNTTRSNIDNNTASHNDHYGIYLWDSHDNALTSNIASGNECGIYLRDSRDNMLISNILSDNDYYGITLRSSDNTLTSNTASGSKYGIHLWDSIGNTLIDNAMIDNTYNFGGGGINDIDTSNTVDGKPIYYLVNTSYTTLDSTSNAGTVYCINCWNISIKDLNLENNEYGIYFSNTTGSNIDNNKVSDNYHGIFLRVSSDNTLTSNNASGNKYGISLWDSNNKNTLTDNTASNNYQGISLWDSSNNTLTGNMVSQNESTGIYLTRSMDNLIYNNYFNSVKNVYDGGNNTWNITKTPGTNIIGGPFLGGNYWSDYAGNDTDGDGLGDTLLPYNSDGWIKYGGDYLPLVTPSGTTPSIPATVGSEGTDTSRVNYKTSESRSDSRLVTRPEHAPDPTVLSFDPGTALVVEGEGTEIRVVADVFPEGLAGYNLTFSIEDPEIAKITKIEFPAWAKMTTVSGLPADSVHMTAFDGDEKIQAEAESVILANLTVSGKASGKTNITITVKGLDDDTGNPVEATVLEGSIEVKMALTPDCGNSSKNPDTVGVFEDFTGNEELSSNDFEVFYNIEWIKENMLEKFFDFNGNGKIDFNDIVVLFKTG